jgi:hypothetical protein
MPPALRKARNNPQPSDPQERLQQSPTKMAAAPETAPREAAATEAADWAAAVAMPNAVAGLPPEATQLTNTQVLKHALLLC